MGIFVNVVVVTEFFLFNIPADHSEENDLFKSNPEKAEHMKALLIKTWEGISADGPNEWWEKERNKPSKGAKLSY